MTAVEPTPRANDPIHRYRLPWPTELLKQEEITNIMIAERMGYERRSVQRWIAAGSISLFHADALAVLVLGRHPASIWPEWLDMTLRFCQEERF